MTDRFVSTVKATERSEYHDEVCTGLALRVSPKAKAWYFHYTAGGRKRFHLGPYPTLSLAGARAKAEEARSTLFEGRPLQAAAAQSLQSVAEEWKRREGDKLRSIDHRWKALERLAFDELGQRPIVSIRRADIVRLLDEIEEARGSAMAHKLLGFLSKIMRWYALRDEDFINPIVPGMGRLTAADSARDRILTDAEIKAIWHSPSNGVFVRYCRFLLCTALRRNEAGLMTWAELADDLLTIPADRMKGGVAFLVPLPALALAQIEKRSSDLVWFGTRGKVEGNYSQLKAELDDASGIKAWTLHDLRRTARSLMARAGVPDTHAEQCLAHKIGGVAGIYNRHAYLDEKRAALAALAELVGGIVNGV